MRKVKLERYETDDLGTFGVMTTDSGLQLYSGELPWRDNLPQISCVSPRVFTVTWGQSPKHGWCYHLEDIAERENCEIHAANWMGDALKGYACQLEGCVALGRAVMAVAFPDRPGYGQKGLSSSRDALTAFEADLAHKAFELTITWKPGYIPGVGTPPASLA